MCGAFYSLCYSMLDTTECERQAMHIAQCVHSHFTCKCKCIFVIHSRSEMKFQQKVYILWLIPCNKMYLYTVLNHYYSCQVFASNFSIPNHWVMLCRDIYSKKYKHIHLFHIWLLRRMGFSETFYEFDAKLNTKNWYFRRILCYKNHND